RVRLRLARDEGHRGHAENQASSHRSCHQARCLKSCTSCQRGPCLRRRGPFCAQLCTPKSKLPAQPRRLLAGRKPSCGVRQARGITAEDDVEPNLSQRSEPCNSKNILGPATACCSSTR